MALPFVTETQAKIIAKEVVKENQPEPVSGGTKLYQHKISTTSHNDIVFVSNKSNSYVDASQIETDVNYFGGTLLSAEYFGGRILAMSGPNVDVSIYYFEFDNAAIEHLQLDMTGFTDTITPL